MELFSVIKNDRTNNELVWKCPKEDFNTNTQLIVTESEEALFVKDGVILQSFSSGKFTLNTDNYPFISKIRNLVSGGENAFNCKVYFIDKTHKLELYWGTDSPIQIRDAKFGFSVNIRARGSYSIQVKNSKKFLIKLVGTNTNSFTVEDLRKQFRTVFQSKIKVTIATVMENEKYTILDMNTQLENLEEAVKKHLVKVMDEYGLELVNFYMSDISIPENDPNYKIVNEAYAKANAGKIEIDVQGNSWEKISKKEIAKDIANNPNSGGIAGIGAGMGMGIASAEIFGDIANQILSKQTNTSEKIKESNKNNRTIKCTKCGSEIPTESNYCPNCGNKVEKKFFCSNCGREMSQDSNFCSNCGQKREQ